MKSTQKPTFHLTRIGRPALEDRLRQSLANVQLEGLRPTMKAHQVVRSMATGAISIDDAVAEIRSWYVRRA